MPDWGSLSAGVAALVLVCVLAPIAWLLFRRAWLSMGHGRVFACSLQRTPTSVWKVGVARFHGDAFQWYRVLSLSLRPEVTLLRQDTLVLHVHPARGGEGSGVFPGHVMVELGGRSAGVSLAMARPDLTAFTSWVEASPPGMSDGRLVG
ncbi:MAG: DUF2550 domain-containing protein [Propioniciclava sp.]